MTQIAKLKEEEEEEKMKTFWIISIEKIIRHQSFGIRPNFEMSTNFQHPRNRYIYIYICMKSYLYVILRDQFHVIGLTIELVNTYNV